MASRNVFGTATALGGDDSNGETRSLTAEQTQRIVRAIARKTDPAIIERLRETLAPLPRIVDLIRGM